MPWAARPELLAYHESRPIDGIPYLSIWDAERRIGNGVNLGNVMVTLRSIKTQIAKLQAETAARVAKLEAQATALVAAQRTDVLDDIHRRMEEHGITTADIDAHIEDKMHALKLQRSSGPKDGLSARVGSTSKTTLSAKKGAQPAKYRDPKTGKTWSGFGKTPTWMANAKDRSEFLIAPNAANVSAEARRAAKAAKTTSSVLESEPQLQRNPQTGETWDGTGLIPYWALKGGFNRMRGVVPVIPTGSTKSESRTTRKGSAK